jgi:hypothetical protein
MASTGDTIETRALDDNVVLMLILMLMLMLMLMPMLSSYHANADGDGDGDGDGDAALLMVDAARNDCGWFCPWRCEREGCCLADVDVDDTSNQYLSQNLYFEIHV